MHYLTEVNSRQKVQVEFFDEKSTLSLLPPIDFNTVTLTVIGIRQYVSPVQQWVLLVSTDTRRDSKLAVQAMTTARNFYLLTVSIII